MRHSLKLVPAVVFACLLGAALAWAGITGSISGVVTDPNGGVVVGAKVTAIETQGGVRTEIATDSQGSYNLPALLVGKYDVEVQSSGFKLYQQSGLVIDVNFALRVTDQLRQGLNTTL
jgi:carboxypeptidase family protein